MTSANAAPLALLVLSCAVARTEPRAVAPVAVDVQAVSFLGDTLRAFPLPPDTRARYERQLAEARAAYERAPADADSIIWLGRRLAYLGRVREAIDVFTRGIALHPGDARLYRHRGHRYITVRELDRAIADLEHATRLVAGTPDEVEPDGQPNTRGIPIGTLHSNIAYHLGLALYLKGDFARAVPVYRHELADARNDDRRVSTAHWLYMSLRRLGRDAEAAALLAGIPDSVHVIENDTYHRLLLMYRGALPPDSLARSDSSGAMSVTDATGAYGVGNWHLYHGRPADAERLFRRIVAGGQWGAFGHIAAEAELARMGRPASAAATARDTAMRLVVTLDRPDWEYRTGDTARFTVALMGAGRPVPGARVRIELGPERMPPIRVDTVDLASGPRTLAGTLGAPGFLRLRASADVAGGTYTGMATAAFSPERIGPTARMPDDFEAFWRRAIADARRVPLEPVLTRMPERSTPEVDVYHVSFQNHRAGSRLYGILSVPTRPGRYPAMLVVPGAGVRPYFPSVATARRGVIHLAIGIHGIPVDRDSLLYNELRATALQRYFTYGLEDRDLYYYKRVHVGVVRAGDFIFALPQFDGTNYVVQGGSQGGGLAIIAGALDPRVKAIASFYPAMADQLGYLHGRAGGWPHVFQDTAGMRATREKLETIEYYDVVNFARLLRVPGIYAWGFNDLTVPPTSMYAAYNVITAPKEVLVVPETGHSRVQSQIDRIDAWMMARLGVAGQ